MRKTFLVAQVFEMMVPAWRGSSRFPARSQFGNRNVNSSAKNGVLKFAEQESSKMTHILKTIRSTIYKSAVVMAVLAPTYAGAQLYTLSKQELIDYTTKSPFGRFADGRPKVPDAMLERARDLSSEEVWAGLPEHG